MLEFLKKENALIFRILHRDNFPAILRDGILSRNAASRKHGYVDIGNLDLISRRQSHHVNIAPETTLADYVPFYFTPKSIMLYIIHTGRGVKQQSNSDIVIICTSLNRLESRGVQFIFSDRHAFLASARFYRSLSDLDKIDWKSLQNCDFRVDHNNPEKKERYMAEALVNHSMTCDSLLGVACCNEAVKSDINQILVAAGKSMKVLSKPDWYFS